MKTVKVRQFYHNASLVDGLTDGSNWSSRPTEDLNLPSARRRVQEWTAIWLKSAL